MLTFVMCPVASSWRTAARAPDGLAISSALRSGAEVVIRGAPNRSPGSRRPRRTRARAPPERGHHARRTVAGGKPGFAMGDDARAARGQVRVGAAARSATSAQESGAGRGRAQRWHAATVARAPKRSLTAP
jgi:hypothetical protein